MRFQNNLTLVFLFLVSPFSNYRTYCHSKIYPNYIHLVSNSFQFLLGSTSCSAFRCHAYHCLLSSGQSANLEGPSWCSAHHHAVKRWEVWGQSDPHWLSWDECPGQLESLGTSVLTSSCLVHLPREQYIRQLSYVPQHEKTGKHCCNWISSLLSIFLTVTRLIFLTMTRLMIFYLGNHFIFYSFPNNISQVAYCTQSKLESKNFCYMLWTCFWPFAYSFTKKLLVPNWSA